MVTGQHDPPAALLGRSLHHVDARAVVPLHVAVAGREVRGPAGVQVASDGERFEEHLGHHHRAAQIEYYPPSVEVGECRGEPLEVAVARGAECRAVGGGVLVDDLRADRRVYRDRHAEVLARDEHGHGASGEPLPLLQIAGERLAHAALLAGAGGYRGVHLPAGLFGHAEGPVAQPGGDVFARAPVGGELEVVDRRAAVHRHMRDDLPPQQLDEQRPQADLDHVTAEHRHDGAAAGGLRGLLDHETQFAGGEDIREGAPEGGEAPVRAGSVGEEGGIDFVGALSDRDGLESAEVRLAVIGHGCSGTAYSLSFRVTWPNEKLDCNASMTRCSSSDSHIRASAFSAKMPRPLGIAGRTTMAFHLCPATLTRSWPTTVTMTGLRSGRK